MQPEEDPSQFMMGTDRLAADFHRLGDRSVTELRKCVIVVAGLSADYEIEVRMIENNPTGLDRAKIERAVGNQYNRLLRQQHDSGASSASGSTTTADCGENKRRRCNRFEGNCFNCGRKGIDKSGDAPADKKGGGRGKCYVCGSEENFARKYCGLCRSLEHRIRYCEE